MFRTTFALFLISCLFLTATDLVLTSDRDNKSRRSNSTHTNKSRRPLVAIANQSGLDNVLQVTREFYCGSEPKDEQGFASLVKLGIKTIVSVDGVRPNVELARQSAMRYVHIPFGYDGIPAKAAASLTHVVREADRPIYIHCHHGRHRGPAAAVIAGIATGEFDNASASAILRAAKTGSEYVGLWRDVSRFQPPCDSDVLPELVEIAAVDPLVTRMVKIDRDLNRLIEYQQSNWRARGARLDRRAPSEVALMIFEQLRETNRNLRTEVGDHFKRMLSKSALSAHDLGDALQRR